MGEARRRAASGKGRSTRRSNNRGLLLLAVGAALALVVSALVIPGLVGSERSGFTDVNPARLAEMLEDEEVALINVHVPYEGEIPQTDAFIPFDDIASYTDELPEDKDAPIVLYCRTGRMSVEAAEALVDLGYTNVYNLDGGFVGWASEGRELL